MSYTITFTKTFIKGNLKGIAVSESLSFVDKNHAEKWVNSGLKKTNYKISNIIEPVAHTKSIGHLKFVGEFEYFVFEDNIYRAAISNVVGMNGVRDGRWECTLHHANMYPAVYGHLFA